MKGIILAGGTGSRLSPITNAVSKQLLPVYDKPMVYYPLSMLMLAGMREIMVISDPGSRSSYEALLRSGAQWGLDITYETQPRPDGLPQALIIAAEFLAGGSSILVLGDNVLYGAGLSGQLRRAKVGNVGATAFGYPVAEPSRFGVIELDEHGSAVSLEEKPVQPRSNLAAIGLYMFDSAGPTLASTLVPSARGELEIIDLLDLYLSRGELSVEVLPRGTAWLDAGTPESLLEASSFVHTIERRQGFKIACPEEIAYRMGFISADDLSALATEIGDVDYGRYISALVHSEGLEGYR